MTSPLSILILAAGKGTRMYSDRPKVLHQIGGQSMLSRVIDTALQLKPAFIGAVIGHGREQVKAETQRPVQWIEQVEQLGTGHAVACALPYLPQDGMTLVLYGDVPLIDTATLHTMIAASDNGTNTVLLTDTLDDPAGYGRIVRENNGHIVRIVEEKDALPEEKAICEINTGIMVLPTQKIAEWTSQLKNANAQGEYYLTDVIALSVAEHIPVIGVCLSQHHLAAGVNNKLQQSELERIFQREQANHLMKAGVTLADPNRFDLRGTLTCGKDVFIDINAVFEGDCVLGNRVQIGANCVLKNVQIAADTVIKPFSHLENCVVGNNAQIGPFARLRPDTVLADNVHIGNFVEVKKSTVKENSKINHLTYIGDSDIGANTNIGAGTITCNYDGVNKFRTEIGDNVFIGSNTLLVAPVKVGNGATTGAGSVITKNCPENELTVARAKQITLSGWARPVKK